MNFIRRPIQRLMRWAISTDGSVSGGNFAPWLGGRSSAAGPVINEVTALTIPGFFHALRLYGQTLGMLDWDVIEIIDGGPVNILDHEDGPVIANGRYIAGNHPVHRLLHDEPNEFQVASSFRETIIGHAIAFGNGYAFIERNGNFRPTALIPLMPDRTYPRRRGGELEYVTQVNGMEQILQPYQVFHIPGFGGNGLTGYPLVQLMRDSLGLTKAETDFASAFFRNGCSFGGTITTDGVLSDKSFANLKKSVAEQYSGLGGAFKWLFLEEGLKAQQFGVEPEKAQLLPARQFSISELSRITGLPGHLLGDLSKASFASVEHLGIEAVTYSFKPWANKIAQEANRKLFYESEKDRYITQIDVRPLMAGDSKTQAEVEQIKFNCASITPNEIRAKDGRNPLPGGDELFVNQATLPLNIAIQRAIAQAVAAHASAGTQPPQGLLDVAPALPALPAPAANSAEDEPIPDPAKSGQVKDPDGQPGPHVDAAQVDDFRSIFYPVVNDMANRLMRRERKIVEQAVRKHSHDPVALKAWMIGHQTDTRYHVSEVIEPVVTTFVRMAGGSRSVGGIVEEVADKFVERSTGDIRFFINKPTDEPADELALLAEGMEERIEQITNDILGENENERNQD